MNNHLDNALNNMAENLDISESHYNLAESRYKSIGSWMTRDNSSIKTYNPKVSPQGSFNLGTIVKPHGKENEYDIDLVCSLDISKSLTTQKNLKNLVGEEVKSYFESNGFKKEPKDGRRCWTLEYSDQAKFHLDILPAIPDSAFYKSILESRSIQNVWADDAIAITDKYDQNFNSYSEDWPRSNPKGYSKWFFNRMRVRLDEQRRVLAKSVDQLPDHKIKTPLQKSIQILKHHRDIMFENDQNDKPISIIITTLAAHAYNNESSISEALNNIITKMPDYIDDPDGDSKIQNPVDPLENFADKWPEHPDRKVKFFQWLTQVEEDISEWLQQSSKQEIGIKLNERFDKGLIEKSLGESIISKSSLLPTTQLPTIITPYHRQQPQWPMNLKYNAKLEVQVKKNGWRTQNISSNHPALDKSLSIYFSIKTNAPGVSKYYWQVVNTGTEATNANCLRGDFYDGEIRRGGKRRKEDTSYTGQHCVECFVVQNGICVARTGDFIINIK